MFSIFKKKLPATPVDFSALKTDMHSHLLPGIDDGAETINDSLKLINGLRELGFEQFITTPHTMWDMYKNTPETIHHSLGNLRQHINEVPFKAASEYFLDDHFDEMLKQGEPLLTIHGKMVLVEFSFVSSPLNLKEKIFNLQIKGYTPILAHPERYQYFATQKKIYQELKDMGCLFQLNLLSLSGYYGKISSDLALWMIDQKMINLVGTDLHHQRHLDALRHSTAIMRPLKTLLDSGLLQNPALSI
jgi:protein-tyrosine phosphatase